MPSHCLSHKLTESDFAMMRVGRGGGGGGVTCSLSNLSCVYNCATQRVCF